MSDPIPPGGPERSKRRAILALASGAVVFLCVLVGVSVWMIRGFLNQPEQTITIPEAASKPPQVMVSTPAPGNGPGAIAPVAVASGVNGNVVSIGGLVNNEDGNPVGNATVQLNYTTLTPPPGAIGRVPAGANVRYGLSPTVHTDIQGHWTAPNIPKDALDSLFLQVSSREYATTPVATPPRSKLLDQSEVLVISKGIDLAGTVVDSAGNAVAGADIVLRQRLARVVNAAANATTGADGKFLIHRVAPGQTVPLVVTKAGLSPAFQSVAVVSGGPALTITMSNARDVTGRVIDNTGKSVEGAAVQLSNWHNQPRLLNLTATSDMDGNFALHDAPADEFTIAAVKPGYTTQATQVQAGSAAIKVVLIKQLMVSGTVVDAVTHEPIAQFTVITGAKFSNVQTLDFLEGAGRDYSNGTYSQPLTGFGGSIDAWYVKIEAKGYLPAVSPPLHDSATQNFALQPGKDVTGRVVDAAGQPVAGAIVVVSVKTLPVLINNGVLGGGRRAPDKTDADGQFDLPPQLGDFTLVILADQGFAQVSKDALAQLTDVHVSPWGRIEGQYTGKELSSQQMQLRMNGSAAVMNVFAQASTDDKGAFAFERVPAGDYGVTHTHQVDTGDGRLRSDTLQVVLTTVTSGSTANVVMGGQQVCPIIGHVTDSSGNPIAGADVRVYTQATGFLTTQTDAQGMYEIPDAPLAAVNLMVAKPGFASQNVLVSAGQSNRDVTLVVQPVIRGAVTDAVTHQPVPSFSLRVGTVWGTGQTPQYQNQNAQPGKPGFSNGQYQVALDGASPNRSGAGWILRAEAKGYLPMVSPILSGGGTQDFALQPGVDLKGTVLDAAGNPAAGVTVVEVTTGQQVSISNGAFSYTTGEKLQTGADGQFDFPPQTGKYAIVAVSGAGFAQVDQDALAASPDVHMAAWGRIEGVARVNSKPAANEQISAQFAQNGANAPDAPHVMDGGIVETDGDGHFAFERIAPGKIILNRMIRDQHGNTFSTTNASGTFVTVTAGQTAKDDFGGNGRAVTGRVILPAGDDWKNFSGHGQAILAPTLPPQMPADIKVAGVQAQQLWMGAFALTPTGKEFMEKRQQTMTPLFPLQFNDDGTFRIDDVVPGDYTINAFLAPAAGGRAPRTQRVQFTMPDITPELKDKPLELPDITATMN